MNNSLITTACRCALGAIAAIAASGIGSAQSTRRFDVSKTEDETVKLSPFVVSTEGDEGYRADKTLVGSRTAKNVMDLPGSVSIINQQVISDLNAVEVHDVLQFGVAGVTQNQTINDDVNIRGFRTTFSLRDGITKTSYKRNPMFDVERIEVIKGPGAMLIGNNSFLGGGVNFVTRQPSHRESSDVHVTLSNDSYVRLQANSTGPLIDKNDFKVDYRVTLGYLTANKDKAIENEDQKFVGAGFNGYFGPNVIVMLNAYYFKDNGYFYWEDFLDFNTTQGTTNKPMTAKLNGYSTKGFSPGRSKDRFWKNQDGFASLTMLTKLTENADFRLAYFFNNLVDRRRHVRGITITADNHTLARQDIPVMIDGYSHSLQADFTHKLTAREFTLDTTVGADANYQFTRQDQSVNTLPALDTANINNYAADDAYFAQKVPGAGLPNLSQNINRPESLSYYFQENLSLLKDRLVLVGGLRWFMPGGTNKNNLNGVVTDRPDKTFRTHKYGIVVKPIPAVSLYWTDSQNVFTQTGNTDRFQGNDQLGPPLSNQEGKMKEYGIKLDHRISKSVSMYGSIAYYDMSLTHVRTFGVLPEGNPPGSIGAIESAADLADGWEYEFGLRHATDSGEINLIATFADGKSKTAADPSLMAVDFVPKKESLMIRYGWNTGSLKGCAIGATYFDQSRKRNANFWIDFPATYNLFARYAWSRNWSAQLNLNNITNERYIVAIAANGLVQTEPGFDAKLGIRYAW